MAPGTVGNIVPSYNSEKDRYEETYITDDFVAVEVPGTADHLWYVTIDRAQLPAGCTNGSRLTVGEFSTIVANDESLASLLSAEHRTMAQSTEETGPVDMVKFIAAWASWADFSRNNTPPAFHLINNTGKNKGKGTSYILHLHLRTQVLTCFKVLLAINRERWKRLPKLLRLPRTSMW